MRLAVGDILRAPRSRSGRTWRVAAFLPGEWVMLDPIGSDVKPAQVRGRMNGGVRSISRTQAELEPWEVVRLACGCRPENWCRICDPTMGGNST